MKRIIQTELAPAAIGPYSQAVEEAGTLYLSGMLPIDPGSGAMVGDTAAAQTEQILHNIRALLGAEGLTLRHVVKCTLFLCDLSDFAAVNEVYGAAFSVEPPARSCVEVSALPKGALVEMECIACR